MLVDNEPPAEDSEASDVPEPSDLDEDHPGAYWSNAGFASLRAVAEALGLDPRSAWVESASGELLFELAGGGPAGDPPRLISISPDPVPADLTGDDRTDLKDLALYLDWLSARQPWADLDENGRTDSADLVRYLSMWSVGG